MAKFCSSNILNAAATVIRDNCAKIAVCTTVSITNVAEAQGAMLAETTLTTGASTSFTIADGDVSGRKITISQQSSIAVASTGVAGQIALYTTVGGSTVLYYLTNCTTQALASTSNKVTIPAWKIEFRDAT